jgi:O-acetyl-ADP-ribose deacetylase (regulator of RNase III)
MATATSVTSKTTVPKNWSQLVQGSAPTLSTPSTPSTSSSSTVTQSEIVVMKPIIHLTMDITTIKVDVIAQQSNCVSVAGKGLASTLTKVFGVDVYASRKPDQGSRNLAVPESFDEPGTIKIVKARRSSTTNLPYIACLFSQFNVAGPTEHGQKKAFNHGRRGMDKYQDSLQEREKWLSQCLDQLGTWCRRNDIKSIAFPDQLGCGLGGGKWENNLQLIEDFAKKNTYMQVYICKL